MTLSAILTILIVLAIFGLILWLIFNVIPMPPLWRRIMGVVAVVLILLWLLYRVGGLRL